MNSTRIKGIIGAVLILLQFIASIFVLVKVKVFDFMPTKYLVLFVIILIVLLALAVVSQFFNGFRYAGYAISVFAVVALFWAGHTIGITKNTIDNMGAGDTKDIATEVWVLKTYAGEDMTGLKDAKFGVTKDEEYDMLTIKSINKELGVEVSVVEYDNNFALAGALLKGEIGAMLINSAYIGTIDDVYQSLSEDDENYLGSNESGEALAFSDFAKFFKSYTETVELTEEEKNQQNQQVKPEREPIDTSQRPFIVYISGIDVTGKISTVSRSDVNVIVAINPVTRQISMVTTPRDSFVVIPGVSKNDNDRDKLTHAGLYGTACSGSIATLEAIYGVEIDYYVRVNFTSVVEIVDLLGGVTVNSAVDFTERWDHFHFHKGDNFVNGTQALHFARERYTIAGGDYARGRNHTELIKAILNKAMSPSILANYATFLETASKNIETNFTTDEIAALVKMQLNDNRPWNFVSYATGGINNGQQEMRYTHSYAGAKLCVTILDPKSIEGACDLMERVLNGETVSQEDAYINGTF